MIITVEIMMIMKLIVMTMLTAFGHCFYIMLVRHANGPLAYRGRGPYFLQRLGVRIPTDAGGP